MGSNITAGDSGLKEYSSRTAGGKSKGAEQAAATTLREHARVYFPSLDTIVESKGGKPVSAYSSQRCLWLCKNADHVHLIGGWNNLFSTEVVAGCFVPTLGPPRLQIDSERTGYAQ